MKTKLPKSKSSSKSLSPIEVKSRRILRNIALAVITFLAAIAIGYLFWQPADEELNLASNRAWFTKSTLLNNVYALFDLGVVDLNADRILDVYTANHSDRQFLLLGKGRGKFTKDAISQFGLDQQPEFPGLEPSQPPSIAASGMYIYWQGRQLVIVNHQLANTEIFNGAIELSADVTTFEETSFEVEILERELNREVTGSQIKFAASDRNGRLVINPFNQSIRIDFQLNPDIPLERVFIGSQKVHPSEHNFSFQLRDRHGMAWADLDGSGLLDVFISRGGLRGRMPNLPETYHDELLVNNGGSTYENRVIEANLIKDGCAGHQAAWVDYNNDGLLDIYNVCSRPPEGTRSTYPNQLFRQNADGTFTDVAADTNLDLPVGGHFVWLDADRDDDSDLLWSEAAKFQLYLNQSGKFEPQLINTNPEQKNLQFGATGKLTIADFDADGDFDVFSASPKGNALLKNVGNRYEIFDPQTIGLPSSGLTANWVDYDNDGLTDLHILPHGIYRQNQDGTFTATNLLNSDRPKYLQHALANWFDADNNGTRDLLVQTEYQPSIYQQLYNKFAVKFLPQKLKSFSSTIDLYSNIGTKNHWLELDLVGQSRNRQAIGAQVAVTTANGTQRQIVGQSEGSHYSQGHYRLYFGLGQQEQIDRIEILWTDGEEQTLENVAGDRLLIVQRE